MILKLGGSLAAWPGLDGLLHTLADSARQGHRLLVVPGGGAYADDVRRLELADTPAHWLAVLAMERVAAVLARRMVRLGLPVALVRTPAGAAAAFANARVAVLAPYHWLRRADPLPHGWHVTSDAIAAWVAGQTGATLLVLLKSVDGARTAAGALAAEASVAELDDVVDDYFARALPCDLTCWIVNGRHPERLMMLLERGVAPGTRVRSVGVSRGARAHEAR